MDKDQELIFRAKNYPKQKALGQCFLVSDKVLDAIVKSAELNPKKDIVIEIGPGIGFLTERLVKHCKSLYAIELDKNAETHLKIIEANNKNFKYLRQDFLSSNLIDIINEEELSSIRQGRVPKIKIVANIPYQITTKILLHLLGEIGEQNPNRDLISEINIMVQKEFADRLIAKPGQKNHGAISLFVDYWADVSTSVEVKANCFQPQPKVNSSFIKIKLKEPMALEDPKGVRRFIKAIYANRRKKLKNGLKAASYTDEEIAKLSLEDNLRGETLNLIDIARFVDKLRE
jgi:16S rRNA (adenine1518-N6/adenine1519-N6)-dimethyltransferase